MSRLAVGHHTRRAALMRSLLQLSAIGTRYATASSLPLRRVWTAHQVTAPRWGRQGQTRQPSALNPRLTRQILRPAHLGRGRRSVPPAMKFRGLNAPRTRLPHTATIRWDGQPGESLCGSPATRNATTGVHARPGSDHYLGVCAGRRAEAEGFEPPVPFGTLAFKASALDRSATLPSAR
jgi:hypothetical protein